MELAVRSSVEGGPQVRNEDLSAFVEVDPFGVKSVGVVKGCDVLDEEVDESGSGVVGGRNQGEGGGAGVAEDGAGAAKNGNSFGEEGDGLVGAGAEDVGEEGVWA